MLKRLLVILGFAALLGAGYAVAAGTTVMMTADGPQPALVTVAWGDTVTFANADDRLHQITIPRINLQSPEIPAGAKYEYVFNGRRGNYGYRQTEGGPNKLGTIVVDLKGSVSLKASATNLRWGKSLRLSGVSTFGDSPVNIAERVPGGGTNWKLVDTVKPGGDGAFDIEMKLEHGAQFRAQVAADQLASDAVRVSLQPILKLRALSRRAKIGALVTFTASVEPARAATTLELQRLDARHGRWLTDLRRPTKRGQATFKWKAIKGATRMRLVVRPIDLNIGWAQATSPVVMVTGVK